MNKPDVAAAIVVLGAALYAIFGGADFGAGIWDLLGGHGERGERARAQINHSLAPVWEANHVWLIFILVMMWTAFPPAFSAIMSTLYIPLALAAVGIVLRGSAFAFRKVVGGPAQSWLGYAFAVSSVLTPFFLGTVVGAIASGEVPADGNGDPTGSWTGALPLVIGVLFAVSGAYLAAVFLTHDARASGDEDLGDYFAGRALAAGGVAGIAAVVGVVALRADARFVYDGLTGPGLPLVIVSGLCGLGVVVLLARGVRWGLRPLAVAAVAAVVAGWAVAQHPYLLPTSLTISDAAADGASLTAVLVVFVIAVIIVIPSLVFLYVLSQRDLLRSD